jgi:hypothetical protein
MVARGVVTGMAAGLVGTAAMTLAEKLEQRITGRRNSTVPGRTLGRMLGLGPRARSRPPVNHAMHWGTGMVVGALRGVMSAGGLRGPWASLMHSSVRLTTDQTLENAAGVGAPPWTWPRRELVIDLLEKGVYSAVTGAVSDAITPRPARVIAGRVRGRSH